MNNPLLSQFYDIASLCSNTCVHVCTPNVHTLTRYNVYFQQNIKRRRLKWVQIIMLIIDDIDRKIV